MALYSNPFRPGAGHPPPFLAGRAEERQQFLRLLGQQPILENMVLTGLRGVGKTVLLDSFKPDAQSSGWKWTGADISESTTITEENLAVRICTDLAPMTSGITLHKAKQPIGFGNTPASEEYPLDYTCLRQFYEQTPGLVVDKLKAVLIMAWQAISDTWPQTRGIIFAYDEAQNLSDHRAQDQYPCSLLLDTFQSIQKQGIPMMLVLTGLPTLFPSLVEARTFAERMFRVVFLDRLNADESRDAIKKPVEQAGCPVRLSDDSVQNINTMADGYPYFIQFICREVYDVFIQQADKGEHGAVPATAIIQKLDTDFFVGRWSRATDRQRELLFVIAALTNSDGEFTVQDIVQQSKNRLPKPFGSSQTHQMLAKMSDQGLVFKNRHGRYAFAVPLMAEFIKRQRVTDDMV